MSKTTSQITPAPIPSWIEESAKAMQFWVLSDTHTYRLLSAIYLYLIDRGLTEDESKTNTVFEEFVQWFFKIGTSMGSDYGLSYMCKGLAPNISIGGSSFCRDDKYLGAFVIAYLALTEGKVEDKTAERFHDLIIAGWDRLNDVDKRSLHQAFVTVLTSQAQSELISIYKAKGSSETATLAWLDSLGHKKAA